MAGIHHNDQAIWHKNLSIHIEEITIMNAIGISRIEDHALVRTFCGCFSDMDRLKSELHGEKDLTGCPAINIAETANGYLMEMALPGYKKQDITLTIDDDVLIVKGCSSCVPAQYEEVQRFYKKEFGVETFCRSFLLPEDVESASAVLEGGVLVINLQKGGIHKPVVNGVCELVLIPVL